MLAFFRRFIQIRFLWYILSSFHGWFVNSQTQCSMFRKFICCCKIIHYYNLYIFVCFQITIPGAILYYIFITLNNTYNFGAHIIALILVTLLRSNLTMLKLIVVQKFLIYLIFGFQCGLFEFTRYAFGTCNFGY